MVADASRAHSALGYRKVSAILCSRGEVINPKSVARLRRRDGLVASRRGTTKRRRIKPAMRECRSATRRDEVWSYDFI